MSDDRQQKVEFCFKEQALKKNYALEEKPDDDEISPWTTFILGIATGALGGLWIFHH